jgi:hypothetical protein
LLFVLHGDSSMDYVSIQFSSLLSHIVIMTNVATFFGLFFGLLLFLFAVLVLR